MASVVEKYHKHHTPEVREHVLILLAEARGIGAEDILLSALSDSSLEVRKAAIKYLGIIKGKTAFSVFVEALKSAIESPSKDAEEIENKHIGHLDAWRICLRIIMRLPSIYFWRLWNIVLKQVPSLDYFAEKEMP